MQFYTIITPKNKLIACSTLDYSFYNVLGSNPLLPNKQDIKSRKRDRDDKTTYLER